MHSITPVLRSLTILAVFLLLLGLLFASTVFIILFLFVLFFIILGTAVEPPGTISAERSNSRITSLAGDTIVVMITLTITKGIGMISVVDLLPASFELVEGNNFALLWKGFGSKTAILKYTVKSSAAGHYSLNCLSCEAYHLFDLKAPRITNFHHGPRIEIRPRLLEIKKVRDASTRTRIPVPLGSLAKMGISTLDFKELRPYQKGDPYKTINWKASARSSTGTFGNMMVNDFEKEGKKTVWLFLDRSAMMQFGACVKNAFEYAIEAVNGLADYYLKQDCRVALCTFNGETIFLYPSTGNKQYYKILRELLRLNPEPGTDLIDKVSPPEVVVTPLREAVVRHKKYLSGSTPLCVIVTRMTRENASQLSEGIREMIKYTEIINKRYPIMVINISGYDLATSNSFEMVAAKILKRRDLCQANGLKKGISWVDWNPTRYSFTAALLQQVVKR
ncbi:MAG: hypothetical protein AVO34_13020 [Firmicutes bacterium ML8_F2]|jgi:uncharacterized protein (DUF58 family)|nr:MAG: hypothetical protein AVO34_13020 [Firmicutes bacterium ML8_F2]